MPSILRWSLMTLISLLTLCPLGLLAVASEGKLTPEQLVQQLGDARFSQRQIATEALTQRGVAAIDAVRAGIESKDPEIRFRSRAILRVIRHLERERLINAFIAGLEVETADELPGWTDFQTMVGQTSNSKALFVQMLESEWAFLDAVYQNDPTLAGSLLANRCQTVKMMQGRRPVTIGNIAALVFVSAREDVDIADQSFLMRLLYSNPDLDRAMRAGTYRESLRAIMGAMVGKETYDSTLVQRLNFSLKYGLKQGLTPARTVLRDRLGAPHDRQYSILTLAKLGQKSDSALIDSMLDDSGVVASHHRINNVRITTQVRDIALASLIQLSGASFADYGMPAVGEHPTRMLNHSTVGFATDEARVKAIAKWKQDAETTTPESGDEGLEIESPAIGLP